MQQEEDSSVRSRDLISSSCRLTCGHCSRELVGQVEDLIVDAHGSSYLNTSDVEGNESTNGSCCADTAVWFLKDGPWPDWIQQQVEQSGWTKGRLNCLACKSRVGAFDFVHGGQCGCPEKQLRPSVQLTKGKVDLKRR